MWVGSRGKKRVELVERLEVGMAVVVEGREKGLRYVFGMGLWSSHGGEDRPESLLGKVGRLGLHGCRCWDI